MDDASVEALLTLDGCSFEMSNGHVVEFMARRTEITPERPHGLSYALVFRTAGGRPIVRFDNAHAVARPKRHFRKMASAYDHWHRTEDDKGRPYPFSTAAQLLQDFWGQVKRVLDERGLPNDL